ncbi:MAG: hypothetical protein V1850_07780 [Candidatus Bathyarchaeota archaeon]
MLITVNAEPIESLMNRIMDQYNKQPEGWMVLADHRGGVLILGPDAGYRLKLISINPQEQIGVGIKIDEVEEPRRILNGAPSYGFRPLSTEETKVLFGRNHQGGAIDYKLITRLLGVRPVPMWELQKKKEAFLCGPIIGHPDLSSISQGQRELEARLSTEADKLFRRRYPERATIYG